MRVGAIRAVGPLAVQKLTDTRWLIVSPELELTYVDDNPDGFGYVGPDWACDVVLTAEMMPDTRHHPALTGG